MKLRRYMQAAALLTILPMPVLAHVNQYNPPSRPFASEFDGWTTMHWDHNGSLINVSINSHWILFEITMKLSRYQAHEGYTTLLQNSIPGTTSHTVNISIGGVDVNRHYGYLPPNYDTFEWDGTWLEFCGPTGNALVDFDGQPIPQNQYPPCAGYISIELSPDGDPYHTLALTSPFTVQYDDAWHTYQIFVDTYYNYDSSSYKAQLAFDNTLLTVPWDCQSEVYAYYALTDCGGTFQGGFYFTTDGMDWDIFFDNAGFGEWADTTIPQLQVTQVLTAMNFSLGPDLSDLIAGEALVWQESPWGPYHPTDPTNVGPRAFGYVPEINNWGDEWTINFGTGASPWVVWGFASSEDFNKNFSGGIVHTADSDAW
jgi:hypothetical protein